MAEVSVARYRPEQAAEWDRLVDASKNGTFLFRRGFMDYHADRFHDHSLILRAGGEIVALLPAHEDGAALISHNGLSYGGFITGARVTTPLMLSLFDALIRWMAEHRLSKLIYKVIPHIYAKVPAEEDSYALFRLGARLYRRDVSTAIDLSHRLPFQERRSRGVKKAERSGVEVRQAEAFGPFWEMLTGNLAERHQATPVHSAAEIELLARRFPGNIKLFGAFSGEEIIAGVVIFETPLVAHVQYISASDRGRDVAALDLLFATLITRVYAQKRFFDFGISTERGGMILNQGLIEQKEGFGGRAIVHDFYELSIPRAETA